jgi:hypothetical protein
MNVSSKMDVQWETSAHNPANFTLEMPNSVRTNRIWKILPHSTVIPRMFPNVYAPDSTLVWYQRQVLELPTPDPNTWFRTVASDWTAVKTLTIPDGIYNVNTLLSRINAFAGPSEVWSFDSVNNCIVVTKTPTPPPVVWGNFIDPAHVPPPVSYAGMTYILESPDSHFFDVLGFEKTASLLSNLPFSPTLIPNDPSTFDNLTGSNISMRNAFPLFDRTAHSYATWSTTPYTSPTGNSPNLAGPVVVHLSISDLGDSSTVDAKTGTLQDTLTTVNLGDAAFGEFKERLCHDAESEAIQYQQARNVSNFRISLTDSRNRQLVLPRNFEVFVKLRMVHTTD